jgi:cell division protein FtsI/penicillin-binding protein 2
LRAARASDLRYYVQGLLVLEPTERREIRRLERRSDSRRSYLEYVAALRGSAPADLLAERERAWSASLEHLAVLAQRLEWEEGGRKLSSRPAAFRAFVHDLEQWRCSIEDASATALFQELFDFHPGRVDPELLVRAFDLQWLRVQLGWNEARVRLWANQARSAYLDGWRATFALPRLVARVQVAGRDATPDFVLSTLLACFERDGDFVRALDGAPRPWREVGELAVFADLDEVVALAGEPTPLAAHVLPPLDPAERTRLADGATWRAFVEWTSPARVRELERAFDAELGAAWRMKRTERDPSVYRERLAYESDLALVWSDDIARTQAQRAERARRAALGLLDTFEDAFQGALATRVDELLALSPSGRLELSQERGDRLAERSRHVLKDWSSRPVELFRSPDYEVVHLLARDAAHYPGIGVVPLRERRAVPNADGGFTAHELLGDVSLLDASGEIRQREKSQRLLELRRRVDRSETEERELETLMQELLRRDELRGVSGLERSFDEVLRGANGYREELGLEDVFGRGSERVSITEARDGVDIALTIDPELQRAARRAIDDPSFPPGDTLVDRSWESQPVGAIVLLDMQGRVLAAASAPDADAQISPWAEGERTRVVERCFGAADFQPVGSVFKPFVALWALDRLDPSVFDPSFVNVCAPPPELSWSEYRGLRCHSRWGHGAMNLPHALAVSCNPYFAHLGDLVGADGMLELARDFGFGQPTGVLDLGSVCDVGSGFVDWSGRTFLWNRTVDLGLQVRRAANGLQVVEGSPAQVARGYLALARGERVPLRLVERVGDTDVPFGAPVPLPYDRQHLDFIRAAMVAVTNWRDGSAAESLAQELVGYRVAAKTGSADLESRPGDGESKVRKHTWIAGWVPAQDPQLVFAVFVHDTTATSSHSSAYVARELLSTPAIGDWLAERGVPRDFTRHDVQLAPVAFAGAASVPPEEGGVR